MSSVASVGLSPSPSLIFPITSLAFCTSSCCSNIIYMNGHIFVIDLLISTQMFSLASDKVFSMKVSFCNGCSY
jgi:hypothetical protein